MTAAVVHAFVSAIADAGSHPTDGKVLPSDWNAAHSLTDIASLGANTFTGKQTITQGTANQAAIASTGVSVTGSNQVPIVELAATWNTAGIIQSAIKINVTNTASHAASMFANWQENSTSVYGFRTNGLAIAGNNGTWGTNQFGDGSGTWGPCFGMQSFGIASGGGFVLSVGNMIAWSNDSSSLAGSRDFGLSRVAAQVMGVIGASTAGAAVELTEMTAPAAGATNTVRIYAEDNGSGKTRLMAKFATGAAVQIAIEP